LYEVENIWCIVAKDANNQYYVYHVETDEELQYPEKCYVFTDLKLYLDVVKEHTWVGHNLIGYDKAVINKLTGYEHPLDKCIDTFVMSSLFYPDREGHSVEYYGSKLGLGKISHTDWSKFSKDMLVYCIRDVDILYNIYIYLVEESKDWDWSTSLKLESGIADLMSKQEYYGIMFNTNKAEKLLADISKEIEDIENKAYTEIPKYASQVGAEIKKPFKKDGSYTKQTEDWLCSLEVVLPE
jgi:DNA polymerase I-like protein with 3'-5' exonuclease and polymerase domains